ncbi:MAG: hypothetical protein IKH51_01345 [Clostridia bacterium]|nr:hypothetical protein [Clostridia bacterium]
MSEREYANSILEIVPDEKLGDVIKYMIDNTDEELDEKKFELVSRHILEKYRKAFEELAK